MLLLKFIVILPAFYAYATPIVSDKSVAERLGSAVSKRDDVPPLYYPLGQSAATCPANGTNAYDGLEPPKRRKRSVSGPENLIPRKLLETRSLCAQVAQGNLNGYANQVGNTAERLLTAGATYVFSWAFNELVQAVRAWRHNADGTFAQIQSQGWNQGYGTMTLNIPGGDDMNVHFEIDFDDSNPYGIYNVDGEFALFQTATGDRNPGK